MTEFCPFVGKAVRCDNANSNKCFCCGWNPTEAKRRKQYHEYPFGIFKMYKKVVGKKVKP